MLPLAMIGLENQFVFLKVAILHRFYCMYVFHIKQGFKLQQNKVVMVEVEKYSFLIIPLYTNDFFLLV